MVWSAGVLVMIGRSCEIEGGREGDFPGGGVTRDEEGLLSIISICDINHVRFIRPLSLGPSYPGNGDFLNAVDGLRVVVRVSIEAR